MRAETGPMKFGDDWRGVFIRGDEALAYAQLIRRFAEMTGWTLTSVSALASLLESANEHMPSTEVQHLKPWGECVK